MNNERRKTINKIIMRLNKVKDEIDDIRLDISSVKDEDENCLGSLPESMQDGDKAQTMQDAVDALDSAYEALIYASCIDIDEALDKLENAKGE